MAREFDAFLETFDAEARRTADVMRALPHDKYDFRPDPKGRSLGELAWHLSEIDAYMAHGVVHGGFDGRPQGIERPRTVAELAPGYETVHRAASDQLRALGDVDWEKTIPFFDGRPVSIRRILWHATIHHALHHRGQLVLLCRLAGVTPPGLFGPNREETEAFKAARARVAT